MNTPQNPAVLLIAPVSETLQERLASVSVVHRLYEQPAPQTFLQKYGPQIGAVVTRGDVGVDNATLALLPRAGLVAIFGVGTDAVDLAYTRARRIAVTITSGVLTNDVADLAMALLLAGARRLCGNDRFVREGRWLASSPGLGTQVSGKRIGILGMGNIGRAIARRAAGFDMQIRYHDREPLPEREYLWRDSVDALARDSDFLVIAASGGAANRGLINAAVLNAMPAHAWLINVARGSLVDEDALIQALQTGGIAGAGLDVYADEPHVPSDLLALDNVILLPHVASATAETRQKMGDVLFANVQAYFNGAVLPNAI
ncbi:2-hydroxyacid dehydrogenase [Martelella alba]|uniref:2-hydroxyacid dehydrogenase n=1 Tax=Martelella alba TaxID=2590451 RepID=A0ABY2SMG3_9HYPH|nr:2-hydroxyacid dehydrogenase [Martelella alba]TKI06978.1 2-hydroxyacid dehydrogenase [Martelella alba]